MAAPVWVLSVDLQTKTATFQSGMAEAAKSARGAFTDIKSGASGMGREVGYSMTEARHGVMMLGEEFGVHLPRGLTSFIASLGPVGAAMETAFPFLAIVLGATLLLEHLSKLHEAGEKLTEDQLKFGTAVQNTFNKLDEKLLEAQIRVDDLEGNHMAALKKQLELIDHQSMNELVQAFGEVAKAADVVMEDLKTKWYQFGIGSAGAKHALQEFQTQYDSLLAQGKGQDASNLLAGTRAAAQHVLDMQKQAAANKDFDVKDNTTAVQRATKYTEAMNTLRAAGVGFTEKEVEAQQALVDALNAQVQVEKTVAELKRTQHHAAVIGAEKKDDHQEGRMQAWADEGVRNMMKGVVKDIKQMDEDRNAIERQSIEGTREASRERLAAIDAAIAQEESLGMQESSFYRGLLSQRVATARQMAEEEARVKAEAAKEAAAFSERMGELSIAAERDKQALADSGHRVSIAQRVAEDLKFAEEEYQLKDAALKKEIEGLDQNGRDYQNKLKELQDREIELTQQHENEKTRIKTRAEEERNARILAADQRFTDSISRNLTQTLMGHQSFAKMMNSLGNEVVSGMLENAIRSAMLDDFTKEKDAAAAARKAYNIGLSIGGPAGIVLGPVLAAGAFAAVMAFQGGGVVPGVGKGDIVPAMLEPGEGIVKNAAMDKLNRGEFGNTTHLHAHVNPTYNLQAIDTTGLEALLHEHEAVLTKHTESTLRKMNR